MYGLIRSLTLASYEITIARSRNTYAAGGLGGINGGTGSAAKTKPKTHLRSNAMQANMHDSSRTQTQLTFALGECFHRQRDAAGRREVGDAGEIRVGRHEVVDLPVLGVAQAHGRGVDHPLEARAAPARRLGHAAVGEEVHARGHHHEPRDAVRCRRRL